MKKPQLPLSSVYPKELYATCLPATDVLIDQGYYLEIYTNQDGINQEDSSNGKSAFLYVDESVTMFTLLSAFEREGTVQEGTLAVRIIPTEGDRFEQERKQALKNPVSKFLKRA